MAPRGPLEQRKLNTQRRDVPIQGALREVVEGLLLGDGGIDLRSGRTPRLALTNKSWEYARLVQSQLEEHGISTSMGSHIRGYARLWTIAWPSLTPVAAAWYAEDGKKRHVPVDARLTPISVLHWYLGDGGLAKLKGKRPAGYLYTNSFPQSDVERLAAGLIDLGVAARAMRCGAPQDHEWRIYLKHSAVVALLDFIGPPPVGEYAYKWEADVVHPKHHPDGRMAKIKAKDFWAVTGQ